MKYTGTITRIERSRSGVTVFVETDIGARGIELDRDLWAEILDDFQVANDKDVVGWAVEYDLAQGDLTITGPDDHGDEDADAADDNLTNGG
ncbi:MAG: hypothetical protein JXQ72_07530 [Anaerolineae bacterium]|nr:hypothetical protein [Anaerolineae bacterium]